MGIRVTGVASTLACWIALVCAPAALAVTPVTPVTCAGLPAAMAGAPAGEVLQLPAGTCATNVVDLANTNAFTLEGAAGGGTTLTPASAGQPIISSTHDVRFTLTGLTFTDTTIEPAISLQGAGEAVTISNSTFTNNRYPLGFGAAITIQTFKAATTTQPTVIEGDTFNGNQAADGGAVAVLQSPLPLIISGNTFTANSARTGGAMLLSVFQPTSSPVQITGNTFGGPALAAGNTSTGDGGAAWITLGPGQPLTLTSNVFQDNRITGALAATGERLGGGLYLAPEVQDKPFPVTQSHNSFLGNVIDATEKGPGPLQPEGGAGEWILGLTVNSLDDRFIGNRIAVNDGLPAEGGGVGAFAEAPTTTPPVTPSMPGVFNGTNDLFSGNSTASGGWGGAIYVGGGPLLCTTNCAASSVTLNNSTVVGNHVDAGAGSEGGAIWGSPQDHLALRNSIVFANTPAPQLFGFGAGAPSIRYSDVCAEAGGTAITSAAHNICANPKLGAAGAETALSPTLDQGSNSLVPGGVTTDLAGGPRVRANRFTCRPPAAAIVDLGAFEFTGHSPPLPCPAPVTTVRIGGSLAPVSRGATKVKLKCLGAGRFCRGTVEIDTVRRFAAADARARRAVPGVLVLGRAHYRVAQGRGLTVRVNLSGRALSRLGSLKSVKVVVRAGVHTSAGAIGRAAKRTLTLKLRPR